MVGLNLKSCKQSCYNKSPYILAPISKNNTGYHRWQISKSHNLPDVSSGNNDEEITAESPYYRAKNGQFATEVESTQQYVEAQQIGKYIPHILGQPQMIELAHLV